MFALDGIPTICCALFTALAGLYSRWPDSKLGRFSVSAMIGFTALTFSAAELNAALFTQNPRLEFLFFSLPFVSSLMSLIGGTLFILLLFALMHDQCTNPIKMRVGTAVLLGCDATVTYFALRIGSFATP